MNFLASRLNLLANRTASDFLTIIRNASKKAGSSKRNPKQAPGKHMGIRKSEGSRVKDGDLIVKQNRFRYFPGLNVYSTGYNHIRALKSGTVRFSGEKSDMDFSKSLVAKEYTDRGVPIYKKYVNVIPDPQPTLFKLKSVV